MEDEEMKKEEQAYTSIMSSCADAMFRYGIRFVPDSNFVRNCIQDVFVELWDRKKKIKEAQMKSHLFKALRLKILERKSALSDVPGLMLNVSGSMNNVQGLMLNVSGLMSDVPGLNTECAFLLESGTVSTAVEKELLYLRLYEGFNRDQIAAIMGLNRENLTILTLNCSKDDLEC